MRDRLQHFRDRFPLAAIGIEVFSIVLAVLLALTVDQWREDWNNRKLAEAALISIRREVQSNQTLLEDRHPYHVVGRNSLERVVDSVDSREDLEGFNIWVFPEGGRFFNLSGAAYRTAQSSGALTHVDFDVLAVLMAIYEEQESLDSADNAFTGTVLSPQNLQPSTQPYTFVLASGLMNDVLEHEAKLVSLYEQFLEMTTSLGTAAPCAPTPPLNLTRSIACSPDRHASRPPYSDPLAGR